MTQVKDMTDQQLNRALAELMGWNELVEYDDGAVYGFPPDDRWSNRVPSYCNDSAASLEVEKSAIVAKAVEYMRNLAAIKWGRQDTEEMTEISLVGAADLHTASPRERAEAAYITLSSVKE
ncbi:hypothetical protein [Paenibacillus sp. FSL R5-0928]|uniref:hypothetical protein n=1 Tax=Paenibacillus sp. FSL R5-0928 TaxID=2921667 RepID=UPI0030D9F963